MFRHIRSRFYNLLSKVTTSIAFYPALISIIFMLSALMILSFEDNEMTKFLIDKAPFLVINNADTARSILSTLIGGILTLTVFSFSMVMILLNQASSNFSPRLLPGLISNKQNQIVLGFYLGTIIYNILVLISILPSGDSYTLNGFSVLVAIILGIICLGMFVFFIHSISTGIQINFILKGIFEETKIHLSKKIENEESTIEKGESKKLNYNLLFDSAGYFQGINKKELLKISQELKVNILVVPFPGKYMLPNMPLFKFDKNLTDEERNLLKDQITMSSQLGISDNYTLGFKQISEVGIKAMSPGINDPGTAIMTLDYLTEILAMRMRINDSEIYNSEDSNYHLELTTINFEDLIYQILAAYRQYCKHDIILLEKIIFLLLYLKNQTCAKEQYKEVLNQQLDILKEDVKLSITNKHDLEKLNNLMP